jgi:hypothetical protein
MKPESVSKNDHRPFHLALASFKIESSGEIDIEERRRRAIAAAGRFRSGASNVSAKHDEHLADAFQG